MKKIYSFALLFLFFYTSGQAQVTISPLLPSANQQVTITYDASLGNGVLTGESKVYIHTGVVFSEPTGTEWNNTIGNWGSDDGVGEMTSIGTDLWEITFTPSSYYNVAPTENIFRLAIVFRNTVGDLVGKTAAEGDYFVDMDPGFFMLIDSPSEKEHFAKTNANIAITATASSNADFEVFLDNVSMQTYTDLLSITYNTSFATIGSRDLRVEATKSSTLKVKSVTLQITENSTILDIPSGVKDGINYIDDNTVILSLLAPGKDIVHVTGDFNSWAIDPAYQMNRTSDGERFWLQINGLVAGQEYIYQYIVDGSIRIADPFTEKVADPWNDQWISSETYPNLISFTDTDKGIASVLQTAQVEYDWNIPNFEGVANHEIIIYEILIRDFTAAHSYKSIADSMQYLQDLGVNTLHLMPVNEFEGNESWGYNPSFFFAPDKYYGHKNELKALIDAAHEKGIAVIIDLVLNHAFGQNVMARMYWDDVTNKPAADNPWFNTDSPNPCWSWGSDFDHESLYTQNFVDSVNTYWLTEYKVDGFRYDFTKGFTNVQNCGWDYDQSRVDILNRMASKIRETKPNAYIILEHLTGSAEEDVLAANGMLPWKRVDGQYKEVISGHQLTTSDFSEAQNNGRIVYMESHDEERIMHQNLTYGASQGGYDITELPTALDRMALGSAFLYTVPGPKMIWMFGEQGYDFSIDYNGRVGNKPLVWQEYMEDQDRVDLKNTVAALLNLRKNHPVFTQGFFSWESIGETRRINISHADMNVTIIGNFATNSNSITPNFQHTGDWYNYFSGATYTDAGASYLLGAGQWELFTDVPLALPIGFGGVPQLDKPSNLLATANGSDVNLTWADNTSIETGYQIERSISAGTGFALVTTLGENANSFSDTGVADGTYFYRVRATGTASSFSDYSNESTTTIGTPTGFTVYLHKPAGWATAYVYHWNALPPASLADASWPGTVMTDEGDGWYAYTFNSIYSTNIIFNDNGATQSANLSRNSEGWYDDGVWYDLDPRNPLLIDPTTLVATTNGAQIDLTWSDNSSSETGYQIERSATPSSGFALIATVGVDVSTYSDTGLADAAYFYRVRASGSSATFSNYSNESTATVGTPPGITVYFHKPVGWATASIYHWNALPLNSLPDSDPWPGVIMTDDGDDWYVYTLPGIFSSSIIFNNNDNGLQTANLYRDKLGWYDDGVWYDLDPRIPPTVSTLVPSNNQDLIAVYSDLEITFNKNIQKGTGNILIERIPRGSAPGL